jgi:hypothetical protein
VTSLPEGFNPTVGGYLDLRSVTSLPEGFNPTVGRYLDLRSVTSLPEGFNPTVGGGLDLSSVTSLPEGFNPTVGGSLDLRSVTSLPEGFNPTVGRYLEWKNGRKHIGSSVNVEVKTSKSFFWDGFAKIDGMFCQVDSKRISTIEGQDYELRTGKKVGKNETFYIVSKDDFHAHGKDIKTAFEDLQFKIQSERLKNEPINEETLVTVAHYRVITGACNLGCKDFLDRHKIPYKMVGERVVEEEPIKAIALLKLLEKDGAYGMDRFKKLLKTA